MTNTEIKAIADILVKHYALRGTVSNTEVKDEIKLLALKKAKGRLDAKASCLALNIHVATGRDVVELHKGYKHAS